MTDFNSSIYGTLQRSDTCHYTDTLCTTQKQTNLTNSLLQDIVIFNGHNSTKLKEWLMDLETAANITNESQVKLAKAQSRGLTHDINHGSY